MRIRNVSSLELKLAINPVSKNYWLASKTRPALNSNSLFVIVQNTFYKLYLNNFSWEQAL